MTAAPDSGSPARPFLERFRVVRDFLLRRFYLIGFVVTIVLVIALQPYMTGFIPHHHGWVTSHNLAILSHSTPETAFAGYTLSFDDGTNIHYDYFRRSPFLFAPFQYLLTQLPSDRIVDQMNLTHQLMNIVFLLNLWLAFCILRRLLPSANHAMAVALLVFSNYYLMYYRDMFAPDNFSLLGILLIVYGVMDLRVRARRWVFYLCSLTGAALGFGVSSLPVLTVWLAVQIVALLFWVRVRPLSSLRGLVRLEGLWAFVIALAIVGGSIAHAANVESGRNSVAFDRTSVYNAAKRRSGGEQVSLFHPWKTRGAWHRWGRQQSERIERSFYPHAVATPDPLPTGRLLGAAFLAFCLVCAAFKWSWTQRIIALLLASSGVLWLMVLTEHARYHEYSAVTFAGLPLVALAGVCVYLPRWSGAPLLLPALVLFHLANIDVCELKESRGERTSWMAGDYQAISDRVPPGASVFYDYGYRKATPRHRYAHGFFLSEQHIARSIKHADFAISRNRNFGSQKMTPRNSRVFLFGIDEELRETIAKRDGRRAKQRRAARRRARLRKRGAKGRPSKAPPAKARPAKAPPAAPQKQGIQIRGVDVDFPSKLLP